jgi:hypothetical protein
LGPNPEGLVLLLNYSVLYINPKELREEILNFGKRRSNVLELLSELFKIPESKIESFARKIEEYLEGSIKCKETGETYFIPFTHPFNVPYHLVLYHLAINFARKYNEIYCSPIFSLNRVVQNSETDYLWGICKPRLARDGKIVIECEKNGKIIGNRMPEEIYRMRAKEIVEKTGCIFNIDEFLVGVTEELYQYSAIKTIPIKCFSEKNVVTRTLGDVSKIEKGELCRITPEYYYPLFLTLPHITGKAIMFPSYELEGECDEEDNKYYLDRILESSKGFAKKVVDPTVKLLEKYNIRGNLVRVDSTVLAESFIKEIEREIKDSIIVFGGEKGKLDNLNKETKKRIYHVLLFQTPCGKECLDRYLKYETDPHDTDSFVAQSAEILGRLLVEMYLRKT